MKPLALKSPPSSPEAWGRGRRGTILLGVTAAQAILAGCVQVSAPERPIEVNLNINIRQEVVVRLQQDARALIQSAPRDF